MIAGEQGTRVEAARALHLQGLTYSEVGARLGVSESTIRRWLDPAFLAASRRASREAKRRRGGVCIDCGGRTSLGNARRPDAAERCAACRITYAETELRFWTRERLIEAARRWAEQHGRPPTALDWRRADPEFPHPGANSVFGDHHIIGRREGWRTWNDFLSAAGLPVWLQGQHGSTTRTHRTPAAVTAEAVSPTERADS